MTYVKSPSIILTLLTKWSSLYPADFAACASSVNDMVLINILFSRSANQANPDAGFV